MNTEAIFLITASAFIHASWNILCKKSHSSASFFLLSSSISCILLLPFAWKTLSLLPKAPLSLGLLLIVTGFFQALYYISLAKAYRSGEISIVYPIARALPVLFIAVTVFIISGGSASLPSLTLFGALLIISGCFLLPMRHAKDFKATNYLNRSCLFALAAAIGTTGYTVIDAKGMEILRTASAGKYSLISVSILYIFVEYLTTFFFLLSYIVINRKNEFWEFKLTLKTNKLNAMIAGFAITAAYTLILMSMAFVTNVSYVAAFRQLGILIGALMGISIFRETKTIPKLFGIILLALGLILVAFGK